jgi:hypothetical protein
MDQVSEFDRRSEVRHERRRLPLSASCHISTGSDPIDPTRPKIGVRTVLGQSRLDEPAQELRTSKGLAVVRSPVQIRPARRPGRFCIYTSQHRGGLSTQCDESLGTNPGTTLLFRCDPHVQPSIRSEESRSLTRAHHGGPRDEYDNLAGAPVRWWRASFPARWGRTLSSGSSDPAATSTPRCGSRCCGACHRRRDSRLAEWIDDFVESEGHDV